MCPIFDRGLVGILPEKLCIQQTSEKDVKDLMYDLSNSRESVWYRDAVVLHNKKNQMDFLMAVKKVMLVMDLFNIPDVARYLLKKYLYISRCMCPYVWNFIIQIPFVLWPYSGWGESCLLEQTVDLAKKYHKDMMDRLKQKLYNEFTPKSILDLNTLQS